MHTGFLASLVSVPILLGSCHQPAVMPPATACTPPRADWQAPHFIGGLDALYSRVSIDHASNLYLDGRRVTLAGLKSALGPVWSAPRAMTFSLRRKWARAARR
jgi:hypothetical protein